MNELKKCIDFPSDRLETDIKISDLNHGYYGDYGRYYSNKINTRGEELLWKNVVVHKILDYTSRSKKVSNKAHKKDAENFFFNPSNRKVLSKICSLASLNTNAVLKRVIEFSKEKSSEIDKITAMTEDDKREYRMHRAKEKQKIRNKRRYIVGSDYVS